MLESLYPLTAQERAYTLADFDLAPGIRVALATVAHAVKTRRGLILLHGNNGVGKSRLLIAATNAVRRTHTAVFATAERILTYLRAGFDPNRPHATPSYDQRWALIQDAELLAIDELEKYNATDWAARQFLELIDYRWRHIESRLTLLAMNGDWSKRLDPAIRDRCQDGRARIVEVSGSSYRPVLHWSDES